MYVSLLYVLNECNLTNCDTFLSDKQVRQCTLDKLWNKQSGAIQMLLSLLEVSMFPLEYNYKMVLSFSDNNTFIDIIQNRFFLY